MAMPPEDQAGLTQILVPRQELRLAIHKFATLPEWWPGDEHQILVHPFGVSCVMVYFTGPSAKETADRLVSLMPPSEVVSLGQINDGPEGGYKVFCYPAGLMN